MNPIEPIPLAAGPAAASGLGPPGPPDVASVGGWPDLVFALIVGFGVFLLTSLGVALAFETGGTLTPLPLSVTAALYAAHFVSFAGTAYWLGARRHRLSWRQFGLRAFDWRWLVAGLVLAFVLLPVRLLAALLLDWLAGGQMAGMDARLDLILPQGPPALTFLVTLGGAGLLAPLAEEFFFRGLIHRWFWAHWPARPWLRVGLSSFIFALGHFDTPAVVAASFFLGAVCAIVYERSRSLWLPIAIHAINNSLAVLLIYVALALRAAGFGL